MVAQANYKLTAMLETQQVQVVEDQQLTHEQQTADSAAGERVPLRSVKALMPSSRFEALLGLELWSIIPLKILLLMASLSG